MQRFYHYLVAIVVAIMVLSCFPAMACMESAEIIHGQEDLSKLTYEELQTLMADILTANKTYHMPTDSQKQSVLKVTQTAAEQVFQDNGLKVTGWAWFDSEYTYTKNWDLYSLKTHLDYKDSNDKGKQAIVYSEVVCQKDSYKVAYLEINNTAVMDHRSEFGENQWFEKPEAFINRATGIDLSTYSVKELEALTKKTGGEIEANHRVSKNVASIILSISKSELEQYCLKNDIEIQSYAWYDSEYTYLRDWDYYWLETHVDYTAASGTSQKTDKLFSEVCSIDGSYELVFLKMGDRVIVDKRNEIITALENGIPRYAWNNETNEEKEQRASGGGAIPEMIPQVIYITPEPQPEITPQIVYVTPAPTEVYGIFSIDLKDASDEQLREAIDAIKAEQRARIKTHISLNPASLNIMVGKNQKIEAVVVELPEGEPEPKLNWTTSDKNIASCNNGQIKAVSGGTATITCSATLSDGTNIYEECKVQVNIPVSSIAADKKSLNLKAGEKYKPSFTIRPENASNTKLTFESNNTGVATVDEDGTIEATGAGNATITVKAADGSGKTLAISVKVADYRISKEDVTRLLMVATCNDAAEDIFTADGSHYDKRKLHDYTYFDNVLRFIDRGKWTTNDGGNSWHVEDVLVQHRIYGGFFQYRFDITFDGKNYILSNGWSVHAGQRKWLDKTDPTKYGEDDLSNLDFYIIFIVSPKQIGH